jgi:arylformamidase
MRPWRDQDELRQMPVYTLPFSELPGEWPDTTAMNPVRRFLWERTHRRSQREMLKDGSSSPLARLATLFFRRAIEEGWPAFQVLLRERRPGDSPGEPPDIDAMYGALESTGQKMTPELRKVCIGLCTHVTEVRAVAQGGETRVVYGVGGALIFEGMTEGIVGLALDGEFVLRPADDGREVRVHLEMLTGNQQGLEIRLSQGDARVLPFTTCHDITVILGVENPTYPGDTPFSRTAPEAGSEANHLEMGTHNGTHLDSPAHFFPRAARLDDFPIGHFIRPAQVVETTDPLAVTVADLADVRLDAGEAVLFKTRNSREGLITSGEWTEGFVPVSREAAQWCVEHEVPLVGHDYITVDPYGDREAPAHHTLLGNGITILEGVNLRDVPPGRYLLVCLPLRMPGAEGSPCRAVLLSP